MWVKEAQIGSYLSTYTTTKVVELNMLKLSFTIVDSSDTDLNPIAIQALLRSVFGESTIIILSYYQML